VVKESLLEYDIQHRVSEALHSSTASYSTADASGVGSNTRILFALLSSFDSIHFLFSKIQNKKV